MTKEKAPKIIQIISAVGWYAIFDEDSPDEWHHPLACWALMDSGDIVGQFSMESFIESVDNAGNFSKYIHESELKPKEKL